jgi:putative endonuclease
MPVKSDPRTWTDPRHLAGLEGERLAIEHLEARGYTILEHRYRVRRFEVDIVARRGAVVAFVEVKARRGMRFGLPREAVTWAKKREMERVARAWEDRRGRRGDVYRFDVIEVMLSRNGGVATVQHIEDAFRPGWR